MAAHKTPERQAFEAGYTLPVTASNDYHDLVGWVDPKADLDGLFTLFTDDCERLHVKGWLFDTTEGHD